MPEKKSTKRRLPKSHYHQLKRKWLARHKAAKKEFHNRHKEALDWVVEKFPAKEQLASGAVGALMLSSVLPASTVLGEIAPKIEEDHAIAQVDRTNELLGEFSTTVPKNARPLTSEEETQISETLSRYFTMSVKPDVDGLRLNRTYGIIGAEQHLVRYPGDNMGSHLNDAERENHLIYSSGMAPGRGAWGYFAKSKSEFTDQDSEREKWYIAVQTFAAPNYLSRLSDYRDFFKYRKMLVVNPATGQAVVCDIADSGPAVWTGKHLGGSPEVMIELGLGEKVRKGPVLYFFINDPDNKIALGPVKPTGLPLALKANIQNEND